jgi:hypothetical protein
MSLCAMPELIHDTWDAPPIPQHGDLDENSTYAGVGRVLSGWEAMEAELSHLYAAFVGKFHQAEAYREYGAGQIFANRVLTLRASAENFFVRRPNQVREGEFDCYAKIAVKFADRRNEVAHSIVRDLGHVRLFRVGDTVGTTIFFGPFALQL